MPKGKGQLEFSNMPERSPLGKAVIEYLNCRDAVKKAKELLENAKNVAIEQFLASGKKSITIEDRIVKYSHSEKDNLLVQGD